MPQRKRPDVPLTLFRLAASPVVRMAGEVLWPWPTKQAPTPHGVAAALVMLQPTPAPYRLVGREARLTVA